MKLTVLGWLCITTFVITAGNEHGGRVKEKKLSDEDHFEGEEHNPDYDHDAFLGEEEANEFNNLSPEESKERLGVIVDKIDANGDGEVSEQELIDWIKKAQSKYLEEEVQRQWEAQAPAASQDKDHISWDDYQQTTYGFVGDAADGEAESADYKKMIDRDRRRWDAADQDKDGKLTRLEFSTFLHPEEAEHMRDIVVTETIEDIDADGDGKISVEEYIGDMYDDTEGEEPEWVQHERETFKSVRDTNGDGYLDFEEVKAWIMPDDYDHSVSESQHLIHEADVNRDGVLSRQEILDKYDLFVGSQATDFGAALHDEL